MNWFKYKSMTLKSKSINILLSSQIFCLHEYGNKFYIFFMNHTLLDPMCFGFLQLIFISLIKDDQVDAKRFGQL